MENIKLNEGFKQVCVWPCTILEPVEIPSFVEYFATEFGTRVQFLETVTTGPSVINGTPVTGTGGRTDVLFAVHNDDIAKFAMSRFSIGVRWIEDVYGNGQGNLYPARIAEYKHWEESADVEYE